MIVGNLISSMGDVMVSSTVMVGFVYQTEKVFVKCYLKIEATSTVACIGTFNVK